MLGSGASLFVVDVPIHGMGPHRNDQTQIVQESQI